jgi:hypothetical protein
MEKPNAEIGRNKINAYVWLVNFKQFGRDQYLNAAINCTRQALQLHLKEKHHVPI